MNNLNKEGNRKEPEPKYFVVLYIRGIEKLQVTSKFSKLSSDRGLYCRGLTKKDADSILSRFQSKEFCPDFFCFKVEWDNYCFEDSKNKGVDRLFSHIPLFNKAVKWDSSYIAKIENTKTLLTVMELDHSSAPKEFDQKINYFFDEGFFTKKRKPKRRK